MKQQQITRRDFVRRASLFTGAAACAPLLVQCSNPNEPTDSFFVVNEVLDKRGYPSLASDTIELIPDFNQLARTVKSQYERLRAMAQDETQRLRLLFDGGNGHEAITMSIVTGGAARYRHVRLVKEPTGEIANLLWGREGIHPSIKLTDDTGKTLTRDGKPLEFSFQLARRDGSGPRSWLELGIKIAAIALLVWLGASVLKLIVAAIAFIAFNAMVIGIAIAGVALLFAVVRWLLGLTAWTLEDVAALFRRSVDELAQFFDRVVAAMGSY